MAEGSSGLTRLTAEHRRAMQIVSVILIVAGGGLFLSAFFGMFNAPTGLGGPGGMEQMNTYMAGVALRGVIGVVLLGAGSMLARLAFLKPVSELVATETSAAVEHASGAVGRGLASSGVVGGGPREVIKVRCRACGYLDTDDARFCSSCGTAI